MLNRYLKIGLMTGAMLLAASALGAETSRRSDPSARTGAATSAPRQASAPRAPSPPSSSPRSYSPAPLRHSDVPAQPRSPPRPPRAFFETPRTEDARGVRERLPRADAPPPALDRRYDPRRRTDPPALRHIPRRHFPGQRPPHPPRPYVPPYPWWHHWGGYHDHFHNHWWFGWCWEAPWVYTHYYGGGDETLAYEFEIPAPLGYDDARVLYLERDGRDTIRVELVDMPDASHHGVEVVVLRDDGADGTLEQAVRSYGYSRGDALERYWRGDHRGYGVEVPGAERMYSRILYDQIQERLAELELSSRR